MKIFIKIINIAMFPITLILGLILFLSGQSPALSPEYSSSFALLGMSFPIWVVLNIILLFYWAVQLKLKALIPLFILGLHLKPIGLYVQWNSNNEDTLNKSFNIVSYNANLFGVNKEHWHFDSVMNIINQQQPDILLLQEVYDTDGSLQNIAKKISKATQLPYRAAYSLKNKKNYGMCIWSKYPIKHWDKIYFPHETGNMAMFADVVVPHQNQPVRVYNIHLQSIRFDKNDYQTMEEVNSDKSFDKEKTESIIKRIRIAYKKRAPQVDVLKKEIMACSFPKIVAGDFNDVPMSYTYYQFVEELQDAFVSRGRGLETTYKGPFPSFRIDYQLYSKELQCEAYRSIGDVPSDHKMILGRYTSTSN
jgi:endonuclease/exonuclease/phosphatase family metal-dependent hydrolase